VKKACNHGTLSDFEPRKILTFLNELSPAAEYMPLYSQIFGDAWLQLPKAIVTLHSMPRPASASGTCSVQRGNNLLAKSVATVFQLPSAGENQEITVSFTETTKNQLEETWIRQIGTSKFRSKLSVSKNEPVHLLCEQIGLCQFYTELVLPSSSEENDEVHLILRHWKVVGLSLPMWLAPKVKAFESDLAGSYHFFVEIAHPLIGLIVRYHGNLKAS
jgi:Domain of unknown function (DUF4166)